MSEPGCRPITASLLRELLREIDVTPAHLPTAEIVGPQRYGRILRILEGRATPVEIEIERTMAAGEMFRSVA